MKLVRYVLKQNNIEKTYVVSSDSIESKYSYIITDLNGKTFPHPFVKKSIVDKFPQNQTAGVYLSEEADDKVREHFKKLLERRVEKAKKEYDTALNRLNHFKGDIVIRDQL